MASYELVFKQSVTKDLRRISNDQVKRILQKIEALREEPRPVGCEKLAGQANRYRVRQGVYRIIYTIEDNILLVTVVKVGHRKEVYKR